MTDKKKEGGTDKPHLRVELPEAPRDQKGTRTPTDPKRTSGTAGSETIVSTVGSGKTVMGHIDRLPERAIHGVIPGSGEDVPAVDTVPQKTGDTAAKPVDRGPEVIKSKTSEPVDKQR